MKKILLTLTAIFICTIARSDEITINWLNTDKTIDHTTTCTIGGNVDVPIPTKYGYTFNGWRANYIPIEYLESTGTQWIGAGYKFSNIVNARIVLDAVFYSGPAGWRIIGLNAALGGPNLGISDSNEFSYTAGGSGDVKTGTTGKTGQRYLFDLNIFRNTYMVSDLNNNILVNIQSISRNPRNYSGFYLFGYNTNKCVSMKIYYLKLYDNDVLVRDFIPVLDGNGTPCMYDKVENKFYYNQGTGQFIAGPIVGSGE